jgi:hypothetical protein
MGGGRATLSELTRFVLPNAKAGYEHMTSMICGFEMAIARGHGPHS